MRYYIANPELMVSFQRTAMVGSQAGAGAIVASGFGSGMTIPSAPVSVVDDQNGHTNFAAVSQGGMLRVVDLNLGPSLLGDLGGGAGVGGEPGFQVTESPMYPDLAIVGCRLGDAFPSPGVTVTAAIDVENRGLASAPVTTTGQPVVGLRALFIDDAGESALAAEAPLDALGPGERTTVELELEMPHDPVRLRIELYPNPIDRDPTNDVRECPFGAPPPREAACQAITLPDETDSPAALVTWSNAALYDEVMIYRDGSMLASLPGSATSFVDRTAAPAMRMYEVRGRIGASKSTRSAAACGTGESFLRGDSDGTGILDISDAIFALNFLFSGGPEPPCSKAADTDDSGGLDITDPIVTLGYLFLGSRPPASPHPNCGGDPTPDSLPCPDPDGCP
jgi:hypothetical protein